MGEQLLAAVLQTFQPISLLYLCVGFFVGVIFGSLPGLTSTLAIVLLLPMTYNMPLSQALIMCMGVYMAGIYSGCITAITINIPGTPGAVMTSIEGYQMMKQGDGARAIGHATIGSAIGGSLGALMLMFLSPAAVRLAMMIRTPGKFSLILFALVVVVMISEDKRKGIITLIFGLICATVGADKLKTVSRFTFGFSQLIEGMDTVTLIVGCFAISEIISQTLVSNAEYLKLGEAANKVKFGRKDFFPPLSEFKEVGILNYIKYTLIGFFIGVLPGAGASMASFVSYAVAKGSSKFKEKFGKGYFGGIVAPETANNAVCGGALVPLLTLGIPGDGTTAVILGVFLVYGIVPGPNLLINRFGELAPMFVALFVSAAVLLPISLYLFGSYYIKIVRINRLILYSTIALTAILGVFAATTSAFQMGIALFVGVLMYYLKQQKYPAVPFILGVILGPMFEQYLRTTLTIGKMNASVFVTEMDSLAFLILTVLFAVVLPILNRKSDAAEASAVSEANKK
ncbi:tripartite tricarboxylate transporter permease [uncultured Acidaminococcus sp.]|jgi:putative tricarboxylic transport membrane protein|uniref:tripartite tricarboxylate transporter permease n=1 Tax=uncultured Acidaminococcus sp. TaxID=352152 RepID=UPI002676E599|nr:tripartite tricarboxylate transporter permease [uncultured Acidaminococcus sp.]